MTKVRLRRDALAYFRRLARDCPYEIEAFLIGTVSGDTITVDQFCYPKYYQIQTANEVQWASSEYSRVHELAKKENKKVVGSLHSHPGWLPTMSPVDYKAQLINDFPVMGICSVIKRKTKVLFWQTDSCLPCEIKYIGE